MWKFGSCINKYSKLIWPTNAFESAHILIKSIFFLHVFNNPQIQCFSPKWEVFGSSKFALVIWNVFFSLNEWMSVEILFFETLMMLTQCRAFRIKKNLCFFFSIRDFDSMLWFSKEKIWCVLSLFLRHEDIRDRLLKFHKYAG